jgi:hypothetical protein
MSGTRCLLSNGWHPMPSAVTIGAIVLWLKWIATVPPANGDVYSAANLRGFPDVDVCFILESDICSAMAYIR